MLDPLPPMGTLNTARSNQVSMTLVKSEKQFLGALRRPNTAGPGEKTHYPPPSWRPWAYRVPTYLKCPRRRLIFLEPGRFITSRSLANTFALFSFVSTSLTRQYCNITKQKEKSAGVLFSRDFLREYNTECKSHSSTDGRSRRRPAWKSTKVGRRWAPDGPLASIIRTLLLGLLPWWVRRERWVLVFGRIESVASMWQPACRRNLSWHWWPGRWWILRSSRAIFFVGRGGGWHGAPRVFHLTLFFDFV